MTTEPSNPLNYSTALLQCTREYSQLKKQWRTVSEKLTTLYNDVSITLNMDIKRTIKNTDWFMPHVRESFEKGSAKLPGFEKKAAALAKDVEATASLESKITGLARKCCELHNNVYPVGVWYIDSCNSLKPRYDRLLCLIEQTKDAIVAEEENSHTLNLM